MSVTGKEVAKKPFTLSRRIFHAIRKFVFESDKALEEGYAPKYRYLPIVSGLIVPVCFIISEHCEYCALTLNCVTPSSPSCWKCPGLRSVTRHIQK